MQHIGANGVYESSGEEREMDSIKPAKFSSGDLFSESD
jgi:hypothetical protein